MTIRVIPGSHEIRAEGAATDIDINLVPKGAGQVLANGSPVGSGGGGGPVLGTPQTATGTAVNFTGIPSGTRRVTVTFDGLSSNGTDDYLIQLGGSGGIENTGYVGSTTRATTVVNTNLRADGFGLTHNNAATVMGGQVTLTLIDPSTNTWSCSGTAGRSDLAITTITGGSKSIATELTQLRFTTTGGTNLFDAGTINITYEGTGSGVGAAITDQSPVATTSGTAVELSTTIPPTAQRILLTFNGVSTNGTSEWRVQLGDATTGGYITTGYLGSATVFSGSTANSSLITDGLGIRNTNAAAVQHGSVIIDLHEGSAFKYSMSGNLARSDSGVTNLCQALVTLAGPVDRVRITTTGGVNTFDAGEIAVHYINGSSPIGKQTMWIPAAAMTPTTTGGCATLAQVELTANQPELTTLDFDSTVAEAAQFQVAFPKSWDEGTVSAQFFWSHSTTATNFGVVWGIQGVAVSNDDPFAPAYGTAITTLDTGGTTDDLYVSPESTAVTIGGTPLEGDLVTFRVFRDATNGSDNLAIDARLSGIKLFYTTNAGNDA